MKTHTFGMIKPNAVKKGYVDAMQRHMVRKGFDVLLSEERTLSYDDASELYAEHIGRPFFIDLVDFMVSGPVVVMVLQAEDAVLKFRDVMGSANPKTARMGTLRDIYGESLGANSIHGSDSDEAAARELSFMFEMNEQEILNAQRRAEEDRIRDDERRRLADQRRS
jgi:nucleoside-diphosphate kinase